MAVRGIMLIVLGISTLLIGFVFPSRWLIARAAALWTRLMLVIGGVLLTIEELDRARDGGLLPFHRDAMKIRQRTGLPAVPFSTDGAYPVNPRDRLRTHPGPVRLTFAKPIAADEVAAISASELHNRVRRIIA